MTTVRVEDCRALKYCALGMRRYFTKHDLDFKTFLQDGLPAEAFPKDDLLATQAIKQAERREEEASGQQQENESRI